MICATSTRTIYWTTSLPDEMGRSSEDCPKRDSPISSPELRISARRGFFASIETSENRLEIAAQIFIIFNQCCHLVSFDCNLPSLIKKVSDPSLLLCDNEMLMNVIFPFGSC